jgi:NADPH:quinone reductase-like Zn-dependent oxidoreductase
MIQAIRVHEYGGPEQLQLDEIPKPVPQADEVLVHVHAAGVNPVDWKIRTGSLKDFFPRSLPYIPGYDFAGVVEEVGPNVTAFQKGQAVFGQAPEFGTYTEYTIAPVTTVALKPETLGFDEAATISVGATTAWQGLFDHGKLEPGQRVLILGAAGGVGLFAVQFARWKGAHVIGTASTRNLDFVHSLGAHEVIDYTTIDVANAVHDVDLVLDTVGGEALANIWPTLKHGGTVVSIAGQPSPEKARELDARAVNFSAQTTSDLMSTFAHLIDEGTVKVAIATSLPLREAPKAHELSQRGHGRGRIVLHVGD